MWRALIIGEDSREQGVVVDRACMFGGRTMSSPAPVKCALAYSLTHKRAFPAERAAETICVIVESANRMQVIANHVETRVTEYSTDVFHSRY